jgi:hypothetical protein
LSYLRLVKVDNNAPSDLSSSQRLHRLVEPRDTTHLRNALEETTTSVVESRSGILHCANQRTDDVKIFERKVGWVGADVDLASWWEGNAHDASSNAVADERDGVW